MNGRAGGTAVISLCAMVYFCGWVLTAACTYVLGRMLADPDVPIESSLLVSLGAGAVWPLIILGAVELSSIAAYSKATSMRARPEIQGALDDRPAHGVIVPLH